eukprot:TRINITY_DN5530_c0_g1_i2.p1 TRINITY_DN5530_c0_g1~~TRINITY_DN5530_c0_g1_i2.p1  ORF type:complete len:521 (+),score=-14.76 TRINITY_DN5530_c0_g1_i2:163-1563(+)
MVPRLCPELWSIRGTCVLLQHLLLRLSSCNKALDTQQKRLLFHRKLILVNLHQTRAFSTQWNSRITRHIIVLMEERLYIKKAKSNVYCYYTVLCLQCMGIFLGANLLINDKNVIKELDISALELISTLRTISKFLGGIVAAIVAGYGRRRLLLITGFMAVAAMAIGMFTTKWCLVIAIVTLGTLNRVVILPTLVFLKEIVAFSPIYGIIMFQALTNAGNLAGRLISAVFIAAEPYPILYEALYKSSIILFGAVPCIIQLVMFIWKFRYESVLYLIEKGKPLETQDFLKEITGDEALAVEKFEEAKRIIHKQKNFTVKLKDLLTRRIYIVPFLILGPIMFLKYFSFLMPYESFIDYVFPVPIVKGSYTNFLLNEIMDTLIPVGNLLAIYLVRKLSPRLIFTVGLALSAVLSLRNIFLPINPSFIHFYFTNRLLPYAHVQFWRGQYSGSINCRKCIEHFCPKCCCQSP